MPKLTEDQMHVLKKLPYFSKIQDLIVLYETQILSQEKFNEELLKARENYKPQHGNIIAPSGIEMVFVEGGTFDMGCNEYDNGKFVHSVTVSDFYIGKTEVIQAQYQAVMGKNPSHFKGDNLPVESVTWHDAVEFCKKLSQKEGVTYRLPTESEWEYAARGGNQSRGYTYSGSNDLKEVGWYYENSGNRTLDDDNWDFDNLKKYNCQTQPVGTKQPNELGIYDMSGNVWEWCNDWYDGNYYKNSPSNNPTGPSSGGSNRVLRGGSWYSHASFCRVAYRFSDDAGGNGGNGFRVVRLP